MNDPWERAREWQRVMSKDLTVDEVAELMQVSPLRVRRLVEQLRAVDYLARRGRDENQRTRD